MRRQRALIQQIQVEEETKRETPEQRQAKLLRAFERHQVRMVRSVQPYRVASRLAPRSSLVVYVVDSQQV